MEWTSLHILTMVLTLVSLVLATAFRFDGPDNNVLVVVCQCALVLNTASSCYLVLFEQTQCSTSEDVHQDIDKAADDALDGINDETRILMDNSTFETKTHNRMLLFSALSRAVFSFLILVTTIFTVFAVFPVHLQQFQHHLLAWKAGLLFLWLLCSTGKDFFIGTSIHCLLGMVMFAFYLGVDFAQLAVEDDPIKGGILLSLDLCGLFLQNLRWSAASKL